MSVPVTEPLIVTTGAQPGSPLWWVERLWKQLAARQPDIQLYSDYYLGDHPLPWLPEQAQDEFRRILRMTRTNYMGLVCDSTAERIRVEGFRFAGKDSSDKETWDLWQSNNLDSDSDTAWLESLICGVSYFLVAPNKQDPTKPHIWVEHGLQAIVDYDPGTGRRNPRAGLKTWIDDWTGYTNATLYLLDSKQRLRIYKFENRQRMQVANAKWERREVRGEDWGGLGGMDTLPLVEIPNNPRLLTGGRSELYDLTDVQDRINKTVADRLITQDYGAFPQKWISGWPEEDAAGNPTPVIDIGRDRAVTTDVPESKFGQWDSAPLDPYSFAKREDVKDIASRSRTPAQYLLGEMSNVNGETLKASESGHIAKVRQRMRPWAESAEKTMRIARKLAGLTDERDLQMETIFSNPEFRTEGELTDAIVKRVQVGITSIRQARQDLGYTETQIRQLEKDDAAEAINPLVANALRPVTPAGGGVLPDSSSDDSSRGGGGGLNRNPDRRGLPRDRDHDGIVGER